MELVGVRWGDLSEVTKRDLLERANCINGIDGDLVNAGECIVDLTEELSVVGTVIDTEEERVLEIDDEAIIYNPEQGVILESKKTIDTLIFDIMTVTEAAEEWGITEGAIRKAISSKRFIAGIDYRKAGRITLITREAMERVYGKES